MAYSKWHFKARGKQACGDVLAQAYIDAFIAQYDSTIPFDGQTRIIYFFDQGTVIANGGTESSVLLGSFEKSQEFYGLSSIMGVPSGSEVISFNVGSRTIEAAIFPPLAAPTVNTTVKGVAAYQTSAGVTETIYGLSSGDVTNFSIQGSDVQYYINIPYDIPAQAMAFNLSITQFSDDGANVGVINSKAYFSCTYLQAFSAPLASSLGESVFEGCKALASVFLPKVTVCNKQAFKGCEKLVTISLTGVVTFMDSVFEACTALTTVDLSNLMTLGVNVFSGCPNLLSISLPALNAASQYSFAGWGGAGYTLTVPTAMAGNAGVTETQSAGTIIVLI